MKKRVVTLKSLRAAGTRHERVGEQSFLKDCHGRFQQHRNDKLLLCLLLSFLLLFLCPHMTGAAQKSEKCVFVSDRDGKPDLWIINSDGTGLRKLTDDPYLEERPLWSPDGKYIAYDSTRGGKLFFSVWLTDITGKRFIQITRERDKAGIQSWVNSNTIAVTRPSSNGAVELGTVDTRTKKIFVLSSSGTDYKWSPDKKWVLIQTAGKDYRIALIKADGSSYKELTGGGKEFSPSWSPDGSKIVFQVGQNPTVLSKGIWTMSTDGSGKRMVSPFGFLPQWLPDSGKILFISQGQNKEPQIWTVNVDGSGRRMLTMGSDVIISSYARKIAFMKKDELWAMDMDGANPRLLSENITGASWIPYSKKLLCVKEIWSQGKPVGSDIVIIKLNGSILNLTGGKGKNTSPSLQTSIYRTPIISREPVKTTPGSNPALKAKPKATPSNKPPPRKIKFGKLTCLMMPRSKNIIFSGPVWSPDGSHVAFSYHAGNPAKGESPGGIIAARADGIAYRILFILKPEKQGICTDIIYSPGGGMLSFKLGRNLLVLDLKNLEYFSLDPYLLLGTKSPAPVAFSEPAFSSDGKTIIYGTKSDESAKEKDPGTSGLWQIKLPGKKLISTIKDNGTDYSESHPSWSPGGKYLVYFLVKNGTSQLMILNKNEDIAKSKVLTRETAPAKITWSKDGKKLAVQNGNIIKIFEVPSGNIETQLISGEEGAISPDFSKLIYTDEETITIKYIKSGKTRRIDSGGKKIKVSGKFAWSADGKKAAFIWQNRLWITETEE
ncbi:MAG: hypothetical protein M1536_08275 [Firmicutes bacterium]|nr:hypothetical protein [Bacillota bacterium]